MLKLENMTEEKEAKDHGRRELDKQSISGEVNNMAKQKKNTIQSHLRLIQKLQSIGPLEITDLNAFLVQAKIDFEYLFKDKTIFDFRISDFKIIRKLGRGGFGNVVLAKMKSDDDDGILYAIKAIDKKTVIKQKIFASVYNEKRVLQSLNFPFVVYLKYFFVDYHYLYFVMPFVPGGDFSEYLATQTVLSEPHARFYVSQLILALEYLHYLGLIHRDVKPENIMIDAFGYIKLADFGLCTRCYGNDRAWTMAGTPFYMAPEIIMLKGYDCSVDWWALGILLYVICSGDFPFRNDSTIKTYELIISCRYEVPTTFSKNLKQLLKRLLVLKPEMRIANSKKGANEIKSHNWLESTDWLKILNRTIEAPYIPDISGQESG
uniref:cAMP-dependent protein kinase n=1 Tax=Cuerna arida TaxID=1464854 RepID=A0A1B6FWJ8_9HEMI